MFSIGGERCLASVQAAVLKYDSTTKVWVPVGLAGGISRVQICHNQIKDVHRIVARMLKDREVVLDAKIWKSQQYIRTAPTFIQWRDVSAIVGLNFISIEATDKFEQAVEQAQVELDESVTGSDGEYETTLLSDDVLHQHPPPPPPRLPPRQPSSTLAQVAPPIPPRKVLDGDRANLKTKQPKTTAPGVVERKPSHSLPGERCMVSAQAVAMLYDETTKTWKNEGNSEVQIYHHVTEWTFRVVARRLEDQEIVISSTLQDNTIYHQTTDLFHRWQDNNHNYGLNFLSLEEADKFGQAMETAIDNSYAVPMHSQPSPPVPPSLGLSETQPPVPPTPRRSGTQPNPPPVPPTSRLYETQLDSPPISRLSETQPNSPPVPPTPRLSGTQPNPPPVLPASRLSDAQQNPPPVPPSKRRPATHQNPPLIHQSNRISETQPNPPPLPPSSKLSETKQHPTSSQTTLESGLSCAKWKTATPGVSFHRIPLDPKDSEYLTVVDNIRTRGGAKWISRITEISRVENYKQFRIYQSCREEMERENGRHFENERILWHGTNKDVLSNIYRDGLNRSYCGKNATAYGNGVYFATDFDYSAQPKYSPPDSNGIKYIFQCRTLTGHFTTGSAGLKEPPMRTDELRYNSVANCITSPKIFVIFRDMQTYPEYVISFRC